MDDIVTIFNKSNVPIASLFAAVDRTWYTNRISRANFTISKLADNFTSANLRFANRILVQNDGGIQDWVGEIVPARSWDVGVRITAYSAECILGERTTDDNETLSGVPGDVWAQLLSSANRNYATGITLGSAVETGNSVEFVYNGAIISDAMDDLADDLGYEWWVANGYYNGGNLSLKAYFAARRGVVFGHPLTEGLNLANLRMVEEGEIITRVIAYGMTEDWESPLKAVAQDSGSIYGVKEKSFNYPQTEDLATLQELADAKLEKFKQPTRKFSGTITEAPYPNVGDDCRLIGDSVGFYGGSVFVDCTVRIEDMRYSPLTGALDVIMAEVL